METLFSLYGTIPYRIDKSEIALALSQSGHLGMTIMSPESLTFVTKIAGALEGWILTANANPHPIPYAYMLNSGSALKNRWVTHDDRYGVGSKNLQGKCVKLSLYASDDGTSSIVSMSVPQMDVGNRRIGGLLYPHHNNGGVSSPIPTGLSEIHNAIISRKPTTMFGVPICVIGTFPILGGLASADSIKFCGYPGASMILYHDSSPLFPFTLNPALAIPATWDTTAFSIGTYDAVGTWTEVEAKGVITFAFHKIGTLTPTQIQTALYGKRTHIELWLTSTLIDHPDLLYEGYLISTQLPSGVDSEDVRLRTKGW